MNYSKKIDLLSLFIAFSGIAMSQSIQSIIHKDGSFDLIGTSVKITNCYPALDNQAMKVLVSIFLKREL